MVLPTEVEAAHLLLRRIFESWPEISAHLLSVTPTAHWLEYADWWNAVVREPLVVKDGVAMASSSAGSGVEWNEPAVAKFLV